jgi:hypothetical protein
MRNAYIITLCCEVRMHAYIRIIPCPNCRSGVGRKNVKRCPAHETVSEPTKGVLLDTIYDVDSVSVLRTDVKCTATLWRQLSKYVMGENVETRRGGRNVCSCKRELVLIYDK